MFKKILSMFKPKRRTKSLVVNKSSKRFVMASSVVNKDAIKRESIDGVEHIIIQSKTLPDDIVMNGGLYPADEIAKSFHLLDRTLAPIEHPHKDGEFMSANDPEAIHGFHAGAFNSNPRRENGVVIVDKVINVAEAMKTDRGKRLLDRINELETSENPRPIHTSVGVFLEIEELDKPKTNSSGDEYSWVARNMVYDHDAILLSSVGAAQPHQGVGMAVNSSGEKITVSRFEIKNNDMSHDDIRMALYETLKDSSIDCDYIADVFSDQFIFYAGEDLFSASYSIDGDVAKIESVPVKVTRDVSYTPKTNGNEGDAMKEMIVNALRAAGIEVDGLTDQQLFEKFTALNSQDGGEGDDEGDKGGDEALAVIANSIKTLSEQVSGLESKINSQEQSELQKLADLVGNSDKYPGIDSESAKKLGVDTLKSMAVNCQPSFALPMANSSQGADDFTIEMPE